MLGKSQVYIEILKSIMLEWIPSKEFVALKPILSGRKNCIMHFVLSTALIIREVKLEFNNID